MWTCKAKAIQVDLGIFAHILSYSDIFIFRTLLYLERWHIQNSVIFRTWHIENQKHSEPSLLYSKPWDIESPVTFITLACWELQPISEPCQTSMFECFAKTIILQIITGNISSPPSLPYEINVMSFFNAFEICIAEVYVVCKKV